MANSLTKPELMALNQAIVAMIKTAVEEEVTKASSQFNKGDIVSFADNNNIRRHGVITKRNQKTFQITTPEHYSINVPATYLRHEPKPSAKLIKFKIDLLITNEDQDEMLGHLIKELRNKNPST